MNVPGLVLHPAVSSQLDEFYARPSHAVLLAGPKGSGKTHIAAALAEQLLSGSELVALANCRIIRPEKGSISIENIRVLIGFFRLKMPGKAKLKRATIIQDADLMGAEAQNALLKLLEEPPADSVIILTTSRPHGLLSTIRSRTRSLQLIAPDRAALERHFSELGYDPAAVTSALLRSGTDIAEAARLLAEGTHPPTSTLELVKKVLSSGSYDRLLLVDGLAKQKGELPTFVDTLTAVAAASLEAAARKSATSADRWRSVLQAAYGAQEALERSGNPKLVLSELMLAL